MPDTISLLLFGLHGAFFGYFLLSLYKNKPKITSPRSKKIIFSKSKFSELL